MRRCLFVLLFAILGASTAVAGSFDINVSDESARATFAFPVADALDLDLGLLYNEEDDAYVAAAGLHVVDFAGDAWEIGVGPKLFLFDDDVDDGGSLALGGFFRRSVRSVPGLGFGGHVYFGPGVLSFGDADGYFEVGARVGFMVIEKAEIYAGARRVEADFEARGDRTIDESLIAGLRIRW